MFDTGGGSSQFTFGHGDQVDERFSVNVGAVRFTERYGLDGAVSDDVLAAALAAIAADLVRSTAGPRPTRWSGWAAPSRTSRRSSTGSRRTTPTSSRAPCSTAAEIDRQIELYRTRTADERRESSGLQPKRADVILAGACIVRTVLASSAGTSLTVSDRGLRHGVLVERFGSGR